MPGILSFCNDALECLSLHHDQGANVFLRHLAYGIVYGVSRAYRKNLVAFFTEQLPDRCHRRLPCARATQGFATELTGAFEAVPVVTGGELIISRLVFTRLVLISAHTKKIDANRHMMAKKPV